jgi:protein TonB
MFAPIVLAILVAHAAVTAQATATQQPPASPVQTTPEKPWPPAGVFRQGDGVMRPRLVKETRPHYTSEAMRAGVEGSIKMEAVVQTDGTVGEVRVVRSLDTKFGVDEEAVKTLKQWRFEPGKKGGVAVPALVEVEMTFTMGLPKRKWPPRHARTGTPFMPGSMERRAASVGR